MQIRARLPGGVKIDMTPLIDVVFQLLAFFCLTFRLALVEGDLAMHPSIGKTPVDPAPLLIPPLEIALRADERGGLRAVELNGRPLAGIAELHREVAAALGSDLALAAQAEARLDCDDELAYEHTVAAVTALRGRLLPSGEIQPLVTKVQFAR